MDMAAVVEDTLAAMDAELGHENDAMTLQDVQAVDLSTFALALSPVSDEELAAHEKVLAELDKASGGKTVWRTLAQAENLVA